MSSSSEPAPGNHEAVLNELVTSLDPGARAANRVVVRWLVNVDVPLMAAGVLLTLDPEDSPMGAGEVAEAIGISR